MSEHQGPLHLQRYLTECNDILDQVIRSSVTHPISLVRTLHCLCTPSVILRPSIASAPDAPERRKACRLFSVKTNDEEGIVHAWCRRCNRMILAYDRTLYWGIKRKPGPVPETYEHMCTCGSHAFEVAFGFTYPRDPLDENDLDTMTIAVRCATCNQVAVVFDDEAT